MRKTLRIPHFEQSTNYDNSHCGPCCIKMLADYFRCVNPRTGKKYSIQSIIGLTGMKRNEGATCRSMKKTLRRIGLKMRCIELKGIRRAILRKHPVLMTVDGDGGFCWHYTVVKGFDDTYSEGKAIIFADPGKNNKYASYYFNIKPFVTKQENWIYEIYR